MEKLNEYLQALLSTCSYELHLEPNKNPYLVSSNGANDVGNTPLLGTQISMMVFPLIPASIKQDLPNSQQVEFNHPHNLGEFNFTVKKSPSGFNVTIRPNLSSAVADNFKQNESLDTFPAQNLDDFISDIKPNPNPVSPFSNIQPEKTFKSPAPNAFQNDLEIDFEDDILKPEENLYSVPKIETTSVNDPQFLTVFSDTSTYEPPIKKSEFAPMTETNSDLQNFNSPVRTFYNSSPEIIPDEPIVETFFESNSAPQVPEVKFEKPIAPIQQNFAATVSPVSNSVPAKSDMTAKERMDKLFKLMSEAGASDLHMSVSMPPMIRKDGKMMKLECNEPTLSPEAMKELLTSIMPVKNQEEFSNRNDSDFAYEIPGLARFRANIFADRKGMGGVFRIIPTKILTAEQLGLSKAIMSLCDLSKGLVVVTGPTGSGKSTTLCAMVDSINKRRDDHIITIEDPIEFVHENQKCLVNQREVHNHTDSFKDALRAALREDPDILLVGEMRDLETISIAIETAETGHLVFGTLHTTTAASTVDRIIDQFPADRQQQIRVMLSESLKGVIAQTLLPKKGGGRVAALEILIVTPAISNLIREGKTFQIGSSMQTGKQHGMVMLNDALFDLVQKGIVEPRDAYIKAVDKTNFESLLTRGGFKI
jgi:twitching motility protein PilT